MVILCVVTFAWFSLEGSVNSALSLKGRDKDWSLQRPTLAGWVRVRAQLAAAYVQADDADVMCKIRWLVQSRGTHYLVLSPSNALGCTAVPEIPG